MQTGVTTRRCFPHAPAQIETGQHPGDGPRRGELPNQAAPEGIGSPEPGEVEGGVTTGQIAGGAGDSLVRRLPRPGWVEDQHRPSLTGVGQGGVEHRADDASGGVGREHDQIDRSARSRA